MRNVEIGRVFGRSRGSSSSGMQLADPTGKDVVQCSNLVNRSDSLSILLTDREAQVHVNDALHCYDDRCIDDYCGWIDSLLGGRTIDYLFCGFRGSKLLSKLLASSPKSRRPNAPVDQSVISRLRTTAHSSPQELVYFRSPYHPRKETICFPEKHNPLKKFYQRSRYRVLPRNPVIFLFGSCSPRPLRAGWGEWASICEFFGRILELKCSISWLDRVARASVTRPPLSG